MNLFGNPGLGRVAYQVGNGEWRPLAARADGRYVFEVPAGETRYGVAVACLKPTLPLYAWASWLRIYQLTTEDATQVVFPCHGQGEEQAAGLSLSVDASALGADRVYLYASFWEGFADRSTWSEHLSAAAGSGVPVLVVAFSGGTGFDPEHAAGVALKRVDLVPGKTASAILTLTSADRVDFAGGKNAGTVEAFDVPAGTRAAHFWVHYYSPRGLHISWNEATKSPEDLGRGDQTGGNFIRVPDPGADDVYVLETHALSPGRFSLRHWDFVPARGTSSLRPSPFPEPWTPAVEVTPGPLPVVRFERGVGPIGYRVSFAVESAQGGAVAFVSPAWLGDRSDYAFPDLTALPGFGAFKAAPGEHVAVGVRVLYSNLSLGEWLASPHWFGTLIPVRAGGSMGTTGNSVTYTVP